jgi:rubrerythrin
MKIKIDGEWVCSICGALWETYHGICGDEPAQCASCGARPDDEDAPYYSGEMNDADS